MGLLMTSRLLAMSRTRQALVAGGLRERGLGTGSGRGFSIVELMAVVVILLVLMGILVTVVSRAQRAGLNARAKANLAVIGQALDQYAHDFKGMYPMSRDANGQPVAGEHLLARALIGPGDDDGVPGPGFRTVAGGAPRNPYLDPGRFKPVWKNGQWEILDSFGTPIGYMPKRNSAIRPGDGPLVGPGAIFDSRDLEGLEDRLGVINSRVSDIGKCVAMALGDDITINNKIDTDTGPRRLGLTETLRNTSAFILISAGPEGVFWSSPGNYKKNDNLYNFDR
jgi:prepilin-type N-terminal cleavage/methylation domain-containing protein